MRQAFDLNKNSEIDKSGLTEYNEAIEKWGYISD